MAWKMMVLSPRAAFSVTSKPALRKSSVYILVSSCASVSSLPPTVIDPLLAVLVPPQADRVKMTTIASKMIDLVRSECKDSIISFLYKYTNRSSNQTNLMQNHRGEPGGYWTCQVSFR